jgi:hypothetical protein
MSLLYTQIEVGETYFLRKLTIKVLSKHSAICGELADEKSEPRYIYRLVDVDDPGLEELRVSCPYAGNELTLAPPS